MIAVECSCVRGEPYHDLGFAHLPPAHPEYARDAKDARKRFERWRRREAEVGEFLYWGVHLPSGLHVLNV